MERACRYYGVTRLEDCSSDLQNAIRKLSDLFKLEHRHYPDYQRDPELTLAYGLFYFPQSFIRIQFPLREILEAGWGPPGDRAMRILDLGCGVGAAGFGAVSLMRTWTSAVHDAGEVAGAPYIEGWALDHSEEALKIHAELSAAGSIGKWQQVHADLHQPAQLRGRGAGATSAKMDLILLSFTLTELASEFEKSLDFWLRRLHPNGVLLVLEPFSKPGKRRLEQYRDRIVAEKQYRVLAPISELTSHKMRTWNLPESMLLLNRNLDRIIDELNYTFLAITPEIPVPADEFVLITAFVRTKGKWIASGRSSDGFNREYEILARHVTPEIKRKLQKLKLGDRVRASNIQIAGTNFRFEDLD